VKRTYYPEQVAQEDVCADLEALRCRLWLQARSGSPWSSQLPGVAYLDQGGGFVFTRSGDAWSRNPNDGVRVRVPEDFANVNEEGWVCEGGKDTEHVQENANLVGSNWTEVAPTGDLVFSNEVGAILVNELGYLFSRRFTFGASPGTGGYQQDLGTFASGPKLHCMAAVRNINATGSQKLEFGLKRTYEVATVPVTEYWDGTAWGVSVSYTALPNSTPYGEVVFNNVHTDVVADSDPTYFVFFGRFTSGLSDCAFAGAVVSVQKDGGTGVADEQHGYRRVRMNTGFESPPPRPYSLTAFPNASGSLWRGDTGCIVIEVAIFWDRQGIPEGNTRDKYLVWCDYDGALTDNYDAIFVREPAIVGGGEQGLHFVRSMDGVGSIDLVVRFTGYPDWERGQLLRVYVSWSSLGWEEQGPLNARLSAALFSPAGVLLGEAAEAADSVASIAGLIPTATGDSVIYLGAKPASVDATLVGRDTLDGVVRTFTTLAHPVSRFVGLWRMV
jgi:hypothetical protein